MNVTITFASIGAAAGPFNLFSDVNAYCCAFEIGVTRSQLLAGFTSNNVPAGTNFIRVVSTGVCNNQTLLAIPGGITTTTTTLPPTTTTTTTGHPVNFTTGAVTIGIPCSTFSYLNHDYSRTPLPLVSGQVIYSDPGTFSPVNGGNFWFKEQISQIVWQVSSAGVISNPTICPTTSTTTTAPITTTTTSSTSTSTSTTTTTTTVAPTTTTSSTTLPAFRMWHLTSPSRTSAAQACLNTNFSTIRYSIYQTGTTPAIGTILYTNSNLTGPWNGGNLWYQVQEAFADNPTSIKVSGTGSVDIATSC